MKWSTMSANNKKINIVSQFWPPCFVGGGEISTYIVCKKLAKKGYKITILTPNVPVHKDKHFKFIKLYNPPKFLLPFEKNYFSNIFLKENLPEGVYWAADYYGAVYLSKKNVKKIATVRDHWPICISSLNLLKDYSACDGCNFQNIGKHHGMDGASPYKKLSKLCSMLYNQEFRKSILSSFDHVVFVSNYIAKKITSKISLKNYSVIYNPLPENFIRKPIYKEKIFNRIIFVGAVIENKGLSILLRALREILKNHKKINLFIIGKIFDDYQNLVENLGITKNITFLNKTQYSKVIEYYNKCDIVVIPSLCFETFGRTVIEGMARKCIPIATNRGGPAEIIKNEQTGFLFEVGNYKQLAQIIISLYKNPKIMKKIQEEAKKFANKNFSPDKIADQYDLIFKNLS